MDRIKTGISGFDQLIDGGIPLGYNVLLVGLPGTGKSVLGLQYLYKAALEGEKGLYISIDSKQKTIEEQGALFGWDIKKLCAEGKLFFIEVPLNRQMRLDIFRMIEDKIKKEGIKRVVFDSLSSFMFNVNQFIINTISID